MIGPIEPAEPTRPAEPTEPTEPTKPTEPTEPRAASARAEPASPPPPGPESPLPGPRFSRRRPPPWWPENEPWPPPAGWRRRRAWAASGSWTGGPPWGTGAGTEWSSGLPWGHGPPVGWMMRRVGCLFALLLLIGVATIGLLVWITGAALGVVHAPAYAHAIVLIVIVIGLFGLFRGARRLGGVAGPVDDLIDAAGRIENGDYTTRIPERGPREVRSVARAFNAMSARLEVTDTRRRTFIADVAHELRTPLAVIEGQVESIVDGVYPADADHLRPILEQTRALEHLVDDLRTLALTEAGTLPLNREPLDLEQLVAETTASFAGEAAAAGITLTVVPPGASAGSVPTVFADPARIRQVLVNLLANALRHTPRGGMITVSVAAAVSAATTSPAATTTAAATAPQTATATKSVTVSVRDTGPGFPPDVLPRAFERFVRGADSSGTGLGLAIARDLVLAHGGEIVASNPPGGGAEVRFSLPVDTTAPGDATRR